MSNYFEKLKLQSRQLDNGIEKLIRIWELPQLLVGGFVECTGETNNHIATTWSIIKHTQEGIENTISEINEIKNDDEAIPMEYFLQESRRKYINLRKECDMINTVLLKYGYQYEDNTLNQ